MSGPGGSRLLTLWLLIAGAALACGGGTDPNSIIAYQLSLIASGGDSTTGHSRTYECAMSASFTVTNSELPTGEARFPVYVQRRLFETRGSHTETTFADSTVNEAVLQYSGLGERSVSLVFSAGSYSTSLGPSQNGQQEYSGDWVCSPEVPLAQDSTLRSYGYPDFGIPGVWHLSQMRPIG